MGFFSWKTSDTNKIIWNTYSRKGATPSPVYMITEDGRSWKEDDYEGYGDFGGKDIYELIAEMNGGKTREDAFSIVFKRGIEKDGKKYYQGKGADFFNYSDDKLVDNLSANELVEKHGWKHFGGGMDFTEHAKKGFKLPKLVEHLPSKKDWKEVWNKLPYPKSAPNQGYFADGGGVGDGDEYPEFIESSEAAKGKKIEPDYAKLEKSNVWGLDADDIRKIEEEGEYDSPGHYKFNRVRKSKDSKEHEYEAVYDGLYMHVFGSLEDLMARKKEIAYYEYEDSDPEETFVDSDGNERDTGPIEGTKAAHGRSLAAINKDRKYFNKNEEHEIHYAKNTGRFTQSYQRKPKGLFAAKGKHINPKVDELYEKAIAGGGVEGGVMDLSNTEKARMYVWIDKALMDESLGSLGELHKRFATKFGKTPEQTEDIFKGWKTSRGAGRHAKKQFERMADGGRVFSSQEAFEKELDEYFMLDDDFSKEQNENKPGRWNYYGKLEPMDDKSVYLGYFDTNTKKGFMLEPTLGGEAARGRDLSEYEPFIEDLRQHLRGGKKRPVSTTKPQPRITLPPVSSLTIEKGNSRYVPATANGKWYIYDSSNRVIVTTSDVKHPYLTKQEAVSVATDMNNELLRLMMNWGKDGRSLAATNKDRKYFNKNEEHEVRYAEQKGRTTLSYNRPGAFPFFAANGVATTESDFTLSKSIDVMDNQRGREVKYDFKIAYNKELNSVIINETDYINPKDPYTRTLWIPFEGVSALYSMLDKLMSYHVYGKEGVAANGTTVASVWNVSLFDKDGRLVDQTQIDEKNEQLAWTAFKESGNEIEPGMRLSWEEETDPDEIAQARMFRNGGPAPISELEVAPFMDGYGILNKRTGLFLDYASGTKEEMEGLKRLKDQQKQVFGRYAKDGIDVNKTYANYVNGTYRGDEAFNGQWEEMYALQPKDFKKAGLQVRPEDENKYFYAHYDTYRKGFKYVSAFSQPLASKHLADDSGKASPFKQIAADGTEIDAMVDDYKAIKKILAGDGAGSGMPRDMKVLDIESDSVHRPVFIDYEEDGGYVVMENEDFGRTRNSLSKVKFFFETKPTPVKTPKKDIPVISPAEAMKKKTGATSTTSTTPTATTTSSVSTPAFQKAEKKEPSGKAVMLKQVWQEAKGSGVTLISPQYMEKIEEAILEELSDLVYETMLQEAYDYLVDNKITLKSKIFMNRIKDVLS